MAYKQTHDERIQSARRLIERAATKPEALSRSDYARARSLLLGTVADTWFGRLATGPQRRAVAELMARLPPPTADDLLTVAEVAGELGVSERRVLAFIRDARLPAERKGLVYLVRQADLAALRNRPPGRPAQPGAPKVAEKARRQTRRGERPCAGSPDEPESPSDWPELGDIEDGIDLGEVKMPGR